MFEQWRNYGAAGPAAAEAEAKRGPKGPIFKQYRARWGIGGPFLRPCEGPKFEVTPLCLGRTPRERERKIEACCVRGHCIIT